MERRTRYRVQELGVAELVDELLARGVTYEEIAERVRDKAGVDVGKSSIARYNQSLQRKLRKISETRETAEALGKVIAEKTGNEPDTEMSELLLATIQYTLLDHLGEEELSARDATSLAIAGSQAVKAKASLERIKATERARAARAWDRVLEESRGLLQSSPYWPEIERLLLQGKKTATED